MITLAKGVTIVNVAVDDLGYCSPTSAVGGASMLVEVFGPSCAGKTTVISGVTRALRTDGIVPEYVHGGRRTPLVLRAWEIARAFSSPWIVIWCFVNPTRAMSRHGRDFLRTVGMSKRLHGAGAVCFVDEGPIKRISILAKGSRSPGLLLRGAPMPDVGILVTCDFDVRLDRLRATGRSFAQNTSNDELRTLDEAKARWNDWILEECGLDVLRLDTTTGQDESAQVAAYIRNRQVTGAE